MAVKEAQARWPFVGRDAELSRLERELGQPDSTAVRGVLLLGEGGVGKTRLLDEFTKRARSTGVRVRMVRATASAAVVPLGCLTDVLRERLHTSGTVVSPELLFHETVAGMVAEATSTSATGSWLLAVDDLPNLDDASAAAIHQCVLATSAPIVATARSSGTWPAAIDALWRDGQLELRVIGALPDMAVEELIDQAIDRPLDAFSRQRLLRLAGGNPLVLRELLASIMETDALRPEGEGWSLTEDFTSGVAAQTLVAQRLAITEPALRRAVELVALAEPVAFDVLASLVDVAHLESLMARGMLTLDDGDDSAGDDEQMVRSAHPFYGEVLRAQLPEGRRRRLASELLAALPSGAGSNGPALLRRAVLSLAAGEHHDAALLATASVAARHGGDHELAVQLAGVALAESDLDGPTRPAGAVAALTRAFVEVNSGEVAPDVAFGAALSWARTDEEILAVVVEWVWATMLTGDSAAITDVLKLGARLASGRAARLQTEALGGTITGYAGRWTAARDQALAIIDELRADDTADVEMAARSLAAMAASFTGPSETAVANGARAVELMSSTHRLPPNTVVMGRGGLLYGLAETEGFEASAMRARSFVQESLAGISYLDFTGMWYGVIANQATSMGVLTAATRHEADEAVRFLRWRDPGGLLSFAVGARGCFAALCADLETAARFLDEYDDTFRPSELKTTVHADRGRAWLAFQRGDIDGAIEWSNRGWEAAWERADAALWAAPAVHDLARFGRADLAVDRLSAAAARLRSPFSAALAAHARALADADSAAMVGAAEAFARLQANGLAAEALAQAAMFGGSSSDRLRARAVELLSGSMLCTPLVAPLLAEPDTDLTTRSPSHPTDRRALLDIVREARAWRVSFDGTTTMVRERTGLGYLAQLVAQPGAFLRASALVGGTDIDRPSDQPILDLEARRAIERRSRDLAAALDRARRHGRVDRIAALEDEAEQLADHVRKLTDIAGGSRRFADHDERARTAVRKAIVRALEEIDAVHPRAAAHLRARVTTGTLCRYTLEP